MINIECTDNYRYYLDKAMNDNSFLKMYKRVYNLKTKEECIDNEYSSYIKMKDFKFYSILDNDSFIGYFGSEGGPDFRYLTTFFIDKAYRNKDFYKIFLESLYNKLGDVFGAYRINRNLRAERFLQQLGGEAIVDTAKYRLYLFRRSK